MRAKHVVILTLSLVVGLAAGAAAATAFYWNRATALPTWYSPSGADTALAATLSSGNLLRDKLASGQGVRYGDQGRVEISLTEVELTQLLRQGIAQTPEAAPFLPAAQSLNATISGDRISGGIVINPADLPTQGLPTQARQALETALGTVPMLGDRPLYLGIEGSPRVENGRLVLGDDTRLQVGRIQLSLADVARLTGMDPAQLSEKVNLVLPQAGITLDGLEFVNGEAVLRGTTR